MNIRTLIYFRESHGPEAGRYRLAVRAYREDSMVHFTGKQARHLLMRTLFAGAAAVTLLSGALPCAARAENAKINELVFEIAPSNFPSTIVVTASGNNKWDTIQAGSVSFSAHMKVDTAYPGLVDHARNFSRSVREPPVRQRLSAVVPSTTRHTRLRTGDEHRVPDDEDPRLGSRHHDREVWRRDPEGM